MVAAQVKAIHLLLLKCVKVIFFIVLIIHLPKRIAIRRKNIYKKFQEKFTRGFRFLFATLADIL